MRLSYATYIEDCNSVEFVIPKILSLSETEVFNPMIFWKDLIQEANQQTLVLFAAKQFLETKICKRIDVDFGRFALPILPFSLLRQK
jgi:hypothetical protein